MKNPFKGVNEEANEEINEKNLADNNEGLAEEVKADEEKLAAENSEAEVKEKLDVEDVEEEEKKDPLQEKYDNLNNQYIRLAADFENYRKRHEQEREALLKYGAENTLKKMIEVLDNFERGMKAIETVQDCEKVKECYNLAYKNFTDVLTKAGLEAIKAEGEQFDPNYHEAVMHVEDDKYGEKEIVEVFRKGYKIGEKVVRHSMVKVAN